MALPTASLGQLASMNMPYQIPQYEVTRGRDKVLAAIAAGVGQALAGQIVNNVTSRDFAEQPAGFWSKLIQGPQQTREQYEAGLGRAAETTRAAEDRAARERMLERQIGAEREKEAGRDQQAKADRDLRWKLSSAEADQRNQLMVDDRLAKAALQNEAFAQERFLAEQKLMDMVLNREVERRFDVLDKHALRTAETDERIREQAATPRSRLEEAQLEDYLAERERQRGGAVDPNKRAAVRAFMQSQGQGQPVTRTMPADGTQMSYEDFLAGGLPTSQPTVAESVSTQQSVDSARLAAEEAARPRLDFPPPSAAVTPQASTSPYGWKLAGDYDPAESAKRNAAIRAFLANTLGVVNPNNWVESAPGVQTYRRPY